MRLAIRKTMYGWQVYDLASPWHSASIWATWDLANRELRILAKPSAI